MGFVFFMKERGYGVYGGVVGWEMCRRDSPKGVGALLVEGVGALLCWLGPVPSYRHEN